MEIGKGKEKDSITTSITSLPPYLPPTSSFTPPLTPRTPLRRFRRRCHNGLHPSSPRSQGDAGAQMEKDTFSSTRFRQAFFGGQQAGSRVVKHTKTPTTEEYNPFGGNLQSLSAMPVYKDKSHEELRWEDYQHGDKGGPSSAGQAAIGVGFPMSRQASPFSPAGTFGQTSASVFGSPFATSFPVDHEDMQLAMAIESSIQSAIAEGVSFNLNTRDSRSEPKTEDSEGSSSNSTTSGSCRICLDARVEGALIPCGHMAGCMSCLNEIKRRNLGCPVCRAKICQVVRIYVV